MLCENCQSRPATYHVTRTVNGRRQEMHYCSLCASRMQAESGAGVGGLSGDGVENLIESVFGPRISSRGQIDVLERLSDESRRVLEGAAERAVEARSAQITPEMLLLAILEDEELSERLARQLGADLDPVIIRLEEAVPAGSGPTPKRVTFAPGPAIARAPVASTFTLGDIHVAMPCGTRRAPTPGGGKSLPLKTRKLTTSCPDAKSSR